MTCDRCGYELRVGDFPFCKGEPSQHVPTVPSIIDDTLDGGPRFFDTMGHDDVWIESKSQWKREVEARGLVNVDKHDRAYYQRKFREHDERIRDERV